MHLKRNKIFVEKALNYDVGLYEYIDSSLKTDSDITDWIFSLRPDQAEHLNKEQFSKINTKNLHPSVRKKIYRKYLSKFNADDVLEKALIKQKLLQINLSKKAA